MTPAALTAVATIARELEGLPLAIELAAGRASALTLEEIAARLKRSSGRLDAGELRAVDDALSLILGL
ncbi:MAG: hypothetical protein AABM30_12435 [Actinomycetota bacterium]